MCIKERKRKSRAKPFASKLPSSSINFELSFCFQELFAPFAPAPHLCCLALSSHHTSYYVRSSFVSLCANGEVVLSWHARCNSMSVFVDVSRELEDFSFFCALRLSDADTCDMQHCCARSKKFSGTQRDITIWDCSLSTRHEYPRNFTVRECEREETSTRVLWERKKHWKISIDKCLAREFSWMKWENFLSNELDCVLFDCFRILHIFITKIAKKVHFQSP